MLRQLAETLAFAAAGGLTLGLLGVPAGFLSGSILAVAAAALAGRPMLMPSALMRVLLVLIGISLGAVVTPATLNGMAAYPLSIAALIVAMVCISVAGAPICAWCTAGTPLPPIWPRRRAACRR